MLNVLVDSFLYGMLGGGGGATGGYVTLDCLGALVLRTTGSCLGFGPVGLFSRLGATPDE